MFLDFELSNTLPELYEIISIFGYLEEILVVEKHVGWELRNRREDLWGYVECDGVDAKAVMSPVLDRGRSLSGMYYPLIKIYAERNGGKVSGYFKERERELEHWLMRMKQLASVAYLAPPPTPRRGPLLGKGRFFTRAIRLRTYLR